MLLSARMLNDVSSVNSYAYTDEVRSTEGNECDVYFQLVDASLDTSGEGFNPGGRRYVPEDGASLQVVVGFIDDAKKITRACTQPFDGDPSIWKLSVLSTDHWRGTADLTLRLTEGSKVTNGFVRLALAIEPTTLGY
jgi:hypothetical protein